MKKLSLFIIILFVQISVCLAQINETLKVLAIGNSFSEDAIEQYLHELALAADKQIIIGNLYIGGAPLDLHVQNSIENKDAYSYRKIGLDGKKVTVEKVSLEKALHDEDWDYVSLQQASPLSGKYDLIMESLPLLIGYVQQQTSENIKLIFHQTWAYQQDSKHDGFKNYDSNQMTMYKSIASTTKELDKSGLFAMIIPSGTAIQNARTSSIADHFTRDGYHLELNYGRFTVACTWYEKLFGLDVRKNSYRPEQVTELQAKIAKEAAHKAVKKPYKISKVRL
ncbi:DUF4886 domain-containing protein [Sphingobacterium hungaricum]|uniref:DUF4886 domain-containing protein n=1 Tax=Sphingobacterium hungaricum TaxID=2082723 RepID=A0A928UX74_9SPHI|nr:DUF4886 domain-containing protein [Sphingobacterium hungaricum]MBE8713628.1 DUF4886 domain-containing protein [Sphingobacterium hungaricum]